MTGASAKAQRREGMLRYLDRLVSREFVMHHILPLLSFAASAGSPIPADFVMQNILTELGEERERTQWSAELARNKGTRLTIRYTLGGATTLYAKAYRGELGPRSQRSLRALWENGFGVASDYRVPEAVGYFPVEDVNLLLIGPARGVPLNRVFANQPEGDAIHAARGAARWLLRLHSSAIPALPVEPACERLRILKECDALVKGAAAAPGRCRLLLELLRQVRDHAPASGAPPRLTPTHGQYTPKNVFVDGDRITAIDLDTACLSDPACDVARFVSKLRWSALFGGRDRNRAEQLAGEFLEEYRKAGQANLVNFEYYRALYSLKELAKSAVDPDLTAADFGRAEEFCRTEIALKGNAREAEPPSGIAEAVMKADFIARRLGPLAGAGPDERECEAAIVRNEGTGRITLRYRLGPRTTLYAKLYRDSRPRRSGILNALWEAGFDVPRPLGYLAEHNLLVMSALPGVSLAELPPGDPRWCDGARGAGQWLAALHRSDIRVGHTEADWDSLRLFRIAERLIRSSAANPAQEGWLLDLLYWLKHKLETFPERRPVTQTHGSFHPGHILIAPGVTSVIDLDRSRPSDPSKDVAEFLGAVCYQACHSGWPAEQLERTAAAFLDEYFAAGPPVSPGLPYYCAAYFVLHLLRSEPNGPRGREHFEVYHRQLRQVLCRVEVDPSDWAGMKAV